MSAGITRELTIKYNDLTIGGSSKDYRITGFTRVRQEPEIGQFEFNVLVVGDSESAFSSNLRDFEDKISTPWKDLEVRQGNTELLVVKVDDATALNPTLTCQKVGATSDTGRMRRYHVVATWGRPATYNEDSEGLRDYDVQVSYTPARRRQITMVGTYTAVDSTRSRAKYDAKVEAWATAVLTAIGGTYELAEEDASHNVNDALLQFSRTYDEVIFAQGESGLTNASIVRQTLVITPTRIGVEMHPSRSGTEGLTQISVAYSAWFNKDETTDLKDEYDGLREWLLSQIENYFGGTSFAVMQDAPSYDPVENRIAISMTCSGVRNATGGTISFQVTQEDSIEYGLAASHVWSGRPFSKLVHRAEANVFRTINMVMISIGLKGDADALSEFTKVAGRESLDGILGDKGLTIPTTDPLDAGPGRWYPVRRVPFIRQFRAGLSGNQIELTEMRVTGVRFWAENVNESESTSTPSGSGGRYGNA